MHVITPLPNYPHGRVFDGYKGRFRKKENRQGIEIVRLWLYASNSKNIFSRMLSMLSYGFSLIVFFIFNKLPNKVIIQSPPLIVSFLSVFFLRSKRRKLILNVSDLWPLAGKELGVFKPGLKYKLLKWMEAFNYRNVDVIWGQSKEILEAVSPITSNTELVLYRNYPKFELPVIPVAKSEKKLKIVYAGLLGIAQGIFKLIQNIDLNGMELHLYGAGAEKKAIENHLSDNPNLPIFYHGELERHELHKTLVPYDLAIIPLVNRIYGSVPSKIFEYGKLGLPMLYFGGGEGENIVLENNLGVVAESGNYIELNATLIKISTGELLLPSKELVRERSINLFDFDKQLDDVIKSLD